MSHPLTALVALLKPIQWYGPKNTEILGIASDSRKVQKGFLFVAQQGVTSNGHQFIDSAIAAGAVAIVAESPAPNEAITWIQVADTALALGLLADVWYGQPSAQLNIVAITGTNGKTSTATLLHQLFTSLGHTTGLLSTVENRIGNEVLASTHTTPDALNLHRLLADMVAANCRFVFMEASSHAIHQQRMAGVRLKGAVFTNLSQDHFDYHQNFRNYLNAKKLLFDNLPKSNWALINIDDKNGRVMVQNTKASVQTYSLRSMADFRVKIIEDSILGLHLMLDGVEIHCRLVGTFNAYNILAVYAVARLLDQNSENLLSHISQLRGAEGRFETIFQQERNLLCIVDYAHTPDALEQVLTTLQKLRGATAKVLTVVGCGGDRDATKRPLMAQVAAKYSDRVLLTSDNPRSEAPETILAQMLAGLDTAQRKKTLSIVNREEAIRTAVMLAQHSDIILVAGKGHEKYQEIEGQKLPFDDKKVLFEALGL